MMMKFLQNKSHRGVRHWRRYPALVSFLLASLTGLGVSAAQVRGHEPIYAQTEQGRVEGQVLDKVNAFRGIRYAAPPVGTLRFQPPTPAIAWRGTRPALDFPPACPQVPSDDDTEDSDVFMAEDCLGLNIWTPAVDGEKRPVLVWIHGGGFVVGSTESSWYNGANLAARGDAVVVSINYRLGAWGFLALGPMGDERYRESANVALLDQIAALAWVRDNIANFGGDPNSVTIFGESAGAASVGDLLAMSQAEGLFHKAILQSGGPMRDAGRTDRAVALSKRFLAIAGAKSADDMLKLSMEDLLVAQEKLFSESADVGTFGPLVDGVVIKEAPFKTLREGRGHHVPVLVGTTSEEMRYFVSAIESDLGDKPADLLLEQMTDIAGTRAQSIIDVYQREYPEWVDTVIQIGSDAFLRLPAIDLAEMLRQTQPVYMYLFNYRSNSTHKNYGAAHAMDIPFVFGVLDDPSVIQFTGDDPRRERIAEQTMDAWVSFARNGDPTISGGPDWPVYEPSTRQTMEFGPDMRLVSDPLAAQRKVWGDARATVEQAWTLMNDN
ncbi:carboxylesterase/lipase family protein [Kordiimonas sp.]|uniref:carboxylesterase/lipase family protein n=1 Tax=Kordiimonas sp. TaxID=1970157 RepID=UPI003A8CCC23